MKWVIEAVETARAAGACIVLPPPKVSEAVSQAFRRMGVAPPPPLLEFLCTVGNGATLFHSEGNPLRSGVRLFGMAEQPNQYFAFPHIQQEFETMFGSEADGFLVLGITPGTGSHYFAMDLRRCTIHDCFSVPGEPWPQLAPDFEEFLRRIFAGGQTNPHYWLQP